ncbi:unnamed protein product [Lepeophtheirus salmonis]|uniref:(salmon louse) hypothetical protein n=1 Tax=Lepeophtheirus salmonis TaxID=72036 RepID=A0A7R8DB48_LEPSM|nr:unnamed protein product [Lepeophtheirus salmonis]CAF3031255.1 unnamed protein product [Lepeophtheirus salmonis]
MGSNVKKVGSCKATPSTSPYMSDTESNSDPCPTLTLAPGQFTGYITSYNRFTPDGYLDLKEKLKVDAENQEEFILPRIERVISNVQRNEFMNNLDLVLPVTLREMEERARFLNAKRIDYSELSPPSDQKHERKILSSNSLITRKNANVLALEKKLKELRETIAEFGPRTISTRKERTRRNELLAEELKLSKSYSKWLKRVLMRRILGMKSKVEMTYKYKLESKLSKIKKGSLRKSRNMKEEYISQLLMNSNGTENGIDFIESADIETSPVISKIQPIQAINTLELQHLIPTTTSSENEELKFEDEKNESS